MLEHNNNSTEQDKASLEASASTTDARRSFLKKAAIGAPIVIASSAKPAWGAACMSGIMSGNVSNHQHTCDLQGGLSHGHWKNHYIGSKNDHWTSGQKPAEKWSKKKDLILDSLRSNFKCFYVKTGQTYAFSNFKINDRLVSGGDKFLQLLKNGDEFEREIVTAFINASIPSLNYPYSISDVADIFDTVVADPSLAADVGGMLEGIHS